VFIILFIFALVYYELWGGGVQNITSTFVEWYYHTQLGHMLAQQGAAQCFIVVPEADLGRGN